MFNNSLTESQRANLVRNQELFITHMRGRTRSIGLYTGVIRDNPVIHPTLRPVFAIDISLLELAKEKYDGNLGALQKTLCDYMGYHQGCQPLVNGTGRGWDVRPRIASELVFSIWHENMFSRGYRLLTEKAAAELHDREISIFLRSLLESTYSSDFKRSRKIRHVVKLVRPQQQTVDGYEYTSYSLEAAHSKKEYKFSILAATHNDTTTQGFWYYKLSSRNNT